MIEQLSDIVEELANKVGVYGAAEHHGDECGCRVCWTSGLRSRILDAVRIERQLATTESGGEK
jgi:hypothetical protein